jgi:N-acetyl-beta-hexosaminidase
VSLLPEVAKVTVSCSDASVTEPEGYSLVVTADSVAISASTSQGAAYGLTTLAQLLRHDTGAPH